MNSLAKGPKGPIHKIIQFQKTNHPNIFNLSLSDKNVLTGETNDLVVSDNKDTDRVLATVVAALHIFLHRNPSALIYAEGTTMSRTRLYRMKITRFYQDIIREFTLYGRVEDQFVNFEIGKEYIGFLIQRKSN